MVKRIIFCSVRLLVGLFCTTSSAITNLDECGVMVLFATIPGPPYSTCQDTTPCGTLGAPGCGCKVGVSTNCGCLYNPFCITDPLYNRACTGPKTSQVPCHTFFNQVCCTYASGCVNGNDNYPCVWRGSGVCGYPESYCVLQTNSGSRTGCANF